MNLAVGSRREGLSRSGEATVLKTFLSAGYALSMAVPAFFIALVLIGVQSAAPGSESAIQAAENQRHGIGATLTSLLVTGDYAVVRSAGGIHDGLRRSGGRWRVVCELGNGAPSATTLRRQCGFPSTAAMEFAALELANAAALHGQFAQAVKAETTAYQFAALPLRRPESERMQLLTQLKQQLETGQITRAEAIRKWSELRVAVFLP